MLADKIRSINVPGFRLEPRDAVILISLIGIAGYFLGFFVGLAH